MEEEEEMPEPEPRAPEKILETQKKARNYLQFLVAGYEPSLKWDNKTLFKDREALYALANKVTESKLKSILDWSKERQVHVRVVLKLLNTTINESKVQK